MIICLVLTFPSAAMLFKVLTLKEAGLSYLEVYLWPSWRMNVQIWQLQEHLYFCSTTSLTCSSWVTCYSQHASEHEGKWTPPHPNKHRKSTLQTIGTSIPLDQCLFPETGSWPSDGSHEILIGSPTKFPRRSSWNKLHHFGFGWTQKSWRNLSQQFKQCIEFVVTTRPTLLKTLLVIFGLTSKVWAPQLIESRDWLYVINLNASPNCQLLQLKPDQYGGTDANFILHRFYCSAK